MFIAELDRPWIDTPFLLQGFLVEDEVELAQLRRYCKFILVDPKRSAAGLFPDIEEPRSAPRAVASPAKVVPGFEPAKGSKNAPGSKRPGFSEERDAEFHLSDSGRFKVVMSDGSQLRAPGRPAPALDSVDESRPGRLGSFLERLGDVFRGQGGRRGTEGSAAMASHGLDDEDLQRRPVHHDFIPASIQITVHSETKTIEEEIEPARQAYARVEELSRQVVDDIRNGKLVAIDQIEEVIRDVVDSMMRSADALMWIARLKQQDTAIYGHSLQVAVYLVALGRHLGVASCAGSTCHGRQEP